jgi:hypothetical protein
LGGRVAAAPRAARRTSATEAGRRYATWRRRGGRLTEGIGIAPSSTAAEPARAAAAAALASPVRALTALI